MKRVIGRLATIVAVGFAMGLSAVSGARASDIVCQSPAGGSSVRCEDPHGNGMRCTLTTDSPRPRTRQQHLICGSTTLPVRYERIYAEQQRMLRKGTIQDSDIAAWRARRDACDSVRCLEGMFARFWRERDAMRSAPGRPASPPHAASAMSDPARHQPAQTTTPTQRAQEQPTSTESLAMQVRPKLTALTRPTATPFETPAAWQAAARPVAKGMNSSPDKSGPAALALESLFSGLAILGMGVGFLWTRRNACAQDWPRSTIPAAMVIAYGLLFVNAVLLPFTLGLK